MTGSCIPVLNYLKKKTNLVLENYKIEALERSINSRSRVHNETIHEYLQRLENDNEEVKLLEKKILNSATGFFRSYRALVAFVELLRSYSQKDSSKMLEILSIGCSTGEEVYSLAMLMEERLDSNTQYSITGIDIDPQNVNKARSAQYETIEFPKTFTTNMGHIIQLRNGLFTFSQKIKDAVHFLVDDIFTYKSQRRYDAIVFRNVMIYFNQNGKNKALQRCMGMLKPGGILFLGKSESLESEKSALKTFSVKFKLYIKR